MLDREAIRQKLAQAHSLRITGRVTSVTGLALRFTMPGVRVGDVVHIIRRGDPLMAEVVGFLRGEAVAMPLGPLVGVGPDDEVETTGAPFQVRASQELLGRVVDGLGRPIDGRGAITKGTFVSADAPPPAALSRPPIASMLTTGVRAIDGLLTLGRGQRVGLFAGSGVGKSTLLGAIARGAEADVVVVALVGERGREVVEFLDHSLGVDGKKRSIVVVATSDVTALERMRAAEVATAYAEYFRDQGASVLLLVDSITRYARAQREVGLAAGEPPARRGYPPSVFAKLPRLLERAGQGARGAITAIYTVLVEGSDMEEPIADEVRGTLDGHIVLDRSIAARGRYPAIDVAVSLSRVMDAVTTPEQRNAAHRLRSLAGLYEEKRDLIGVGAYVKGHDRQLDEAVAKMPTIERYVQQSATDRVPFAQSLTELLEVMR